MDFSVLTIFPEMFDRFRDHGIVGRALEAGKISLRTDSIRDFAAGRHRVTDDRPFGGGSGMVMKPEPLAGAIRAARRRMPQALAVLLSPQGRTFNQQVAAALAGESGLILVCGRYEGIDERVCLDLIDEEVSIGDYILSGGEVAAMAIVEAVTRLVPGALGGEAAAEKDSFGAYRLEHPQYTRPREFEGHGVPEVLLSGDHAKIESWRAESALIRTFLKRRDLLESPPLSREEIRTLKQWCLDIEKLVRSQAVSGPDPLPGGRQAG